VEGFGGTVYGWLQQGGIVMYILAGFSIVAAAVIVERLIALRRAGINVNEFLAKVRKALMVNRSIREAIKVCEEYRGPVASIMKAGLLKFGQPKDDIEKTIENAALYEMSRLERFLVVLATIANVAPLLGFFGTVVGMINAFDALAAAGLSNPGLVAIGIKVALFTTAGGLGVAIPVQLVYNYFMSRINRFVRDIETSTNMLLETFGEMERSGITPETAAAPSQPAATSPSSTEAPGEGSSSR